MYSPELLDHFENPRNAGEIEAPDASVQVENPACGDVLALSARAERGRIVEIGFRAKGCVAAIACGSAITEMIKEKTIDEAQALRSEELARKIGGLPEASGHAAQLAMDAAQGLLKGLSRRV